MEKRRYTKNEREELKARFLSIFPTAAESQVSKKSFMIEWLANFAPDMSYADAKALCLPRILHDNYLWHAFSFEKADYIAASDADAALDRGLEGECYVLLNGINTLFTLPDGTGVTKDMLKAFDNIIICKKDFSETYVFTGEEGFGPYYAGSSNTAE